MSTTSSTIRATNRLKNFKHLPAQHPETGPQIKNGSEQPLTDTEKTILVRGLNYNYRVAKKTDFLAVLESTLKNNGLAEEVQLTIRQTIVPILSKK
eukprot:g19783.t1